MNREQMIDIAADIITNPPFGTTEREDAAAVLDAILPQVATVEELAELPCPALLLGQPDGYRPPSLMRWKPTGLEYEDGTHPDPQWVLAAGPLTVVWQP